MCDACENLDHKKQQPLPRREFLKESGVNVLVTSAIMGAGVGNDQIKEKPAVLGKGSWQTRAFAAQSKNSSFAPITITRRALQANDILLDILYVGICHSDIHAVHSDWGEAHYPIVPGHEIVGSVIAVGRDVTKFKVGDIGGVGCMVDSCGACENCLDEREQNCLKRDNFYL